MALLRALQCLAQSSESLIPPDGLVIAHLNHGLRGTASDEDAEWLKQECRRLSLPCVTEKQELNQGPDSGLEEQCRTARYDFLTRVAIAEQCTQIAVAHTLDDQAETVLHHIIRGTGITGLRGIPQTRVLQQGLHLIRPLLQISREEVVEFLNVCGQEYRNDESNADTSFTRNRIRHQLLPLLKKRIQSQRSTVHSAIVAAGGRSDLCPQCRSRPDIESRYTRSEPGNLAARLPGLAGQPRLPRPTVFSEDLAGNELVPQKDGL